MNDKKYGILLKNFTCKQRSRIHKKIFNLLTDHKTSKLSDKEEKACYDIHVGIVQNLIYRTLSGAIINHKSM